MIENWYKFAPMQITGIIPSRYASTRFPGKPLVLINGKTMIQRVYEQASKAKMLNAVYVATDDKRIANHVQSFGGKVILTSAKHQTGTDRCAETAKKLNLKPTDVAINIQGDEPYIKPEQINAVAKLFAYKNINIATLAKKLGTDADVANPNLVKVIFDKNKKAIYFSRYAIPFSRNGSTVNCHKHIGIYAYRVHTLLAITKLKMSALEKAESLEQLRWIENGYAIHVGITKHETISVDAPDDLKKIQQFA
jgi:3-deoxy-manno-octulosonate cytidylyltransferase (CMP-KDO synthetase)